MTNMWPEDSYDESEAYDDGEGVFDDAEDDDGEASRAERRRQARLQRMARQRPTVRPRAAAARRPAAVAVQPTPQQAVTAIRNLDVDNKIQDDRFRRALAGLRKDQIRSNYVTAGSAVVAQVIESFNQPENVYARAALRVAPQLALLKAPTPGVGFVGYIGRNPVIPGLVAVAAITFAGDRSKKGSKVNRVQIDGPTKLEVDGTDLLFADVFDAKGKRLDVPVTWTSGNETKAVITGNRITAKVVGPVRVFAEAGGVRQSFSLEVVPAAALSGGDGFVEGQVLGASAGPSPTAKKS
jgi:hypothetical protein